MTPRTNVLQYFVLKFKHVLSEPPKLNPDAKS